MKESIERIPKYANYYKNYLTFFCKPIFRTIFFDSIILMILLNNIRNMGIIMTLSYY